MYGFDTAAIVTMEEVVECLYNKECDGKVVIDDTLKEAMNVVKDICTPGDVVLLSPACASWDQYDRFEDRGDEFKNLVRER